ncbi:FtsX-like permease family protein, partial [Actinocorallia lasiicapitis]
MWRAARFAVRRRRLQTVILGVVLMVSTATVVLALGLLVTVDKPFDRAFSQVNGAHLTVVYDAAKTDAAKAGATGSAAGVTEAGGPYPLAQLTVPGRMSAGPVHAEKSEQEEMLSPYPPGPFIAVERPADQGGVDRLTLTRGRWAGGPGEIVMSARLLSHFFGFDPLTTRITFTDGRTYAVVGIARSITGSADGWVAPGTLTRPDAYQMLYRLADPGAAASTVTAGLPVVSAQGYQVARDEVTQGAKVIIPFLVAFGVLGLLVAVIIIANVVSGAVVSGFRHIGVLKALGFTPAQVTGVYLIMVLLPGGVGGLAGIGLGNALAGTVTSAMDDSLDLPAANGISVAVDLVAMVAVLAVVAVTALVPAVRAGRIPTVLAISA